MDVVDCLSTISSISYYKTRLKTRERPISSSPPILTVSSLYSGCIPLKKESWGGEGGRGEEEGGRVGKSREDEEEEEGGGGGGREGKREGGTEGGGRREDGG